jgi:hypothetical protein
LIGDDVDSNWDPSLGLIWLSTDKVHEPLGTLTLFIFFGADDKTATIASAVLSKTDHAIGTAAEINGKLYETEDGGNLGVGTLHEVERGPNYIRGKLKELAMTEVTSGESVKVSGWFVATK